MSKFEDSWRRVEPVSASLSSGEARPILVTADSSAFSYSRPGERAYLRWRFRVELACGLSLTMLWGDPEKNGVALRPLTSCCQAHYTGWTCSACGVENWPRALAVGTPEFLKALGPTTAKSLRAAPLREWLEDRLTPLEAELAYPEAFQDLTGLFSARRVLTEKLALQVWTNQ